MYLSRLYIENYRSIEKCDIRFEEGKNVIVGRNNSGKSNILKAIDIILGEYSPTYAKSENIAEGDFFCNNTDKPIFIWCEIERKRLQDASLEKIDFTDVEKSAFFRIYKDKYLNDEIRIALSDFSDFEKGNIFEFCSEEGQAKIDDNQFGKKWIGGKSYCKSSFNLEFSDKSSFALAFIAYKNDEAKITKDLVLLYREDNTREWIQGMNCNIRNILLQSAIIPAFRDPKDQLRINQYSWFGKLLKSYVKTDSKELNDAFLSVKKASDGLFKSLKDKISQKELDVAFPNTTISFQFNPDSKQDIHKSTLIYVNDGHNSELKEKGAGIQSAVTISLFDFYVRTIAHSGSSLLAIEEPELYLHPHGRRVISNKLSSFVDGGKNQVIITTHTPEFISNINEAQNIISVKKEKTATLAKNLHFKEPKRRQILIKKQNAELFFADAVILTEGAEKYFIEEAARIYGKARTLIDFQGTIFKLGENWLNDNNISIINVGGKAELWKYVQILKELKTPVFVTADFDFIRDGLNSFFSNLEEPQNYSDKLNALKQKISSTAPPKYKSIKDLPDEDLKREVEEFIKALARELQIHIFSGELEHFYLIKPKFDKEAGIVATLGEIIESKRCLSEYLDLSEYNLLFDDFVKKVFNATALSLSENVTVKAQENLV